jgi:hypothetical protein
MRQDKAGRYLKTRTSRKDWEERVHRIRTEGKKDAFKVGSSRVTRVGFKASDCMEVFIRVIGIAGVFAFYNFASRYHRFLVASIDTTNSTLIYTSPLLGGRTGQIRLEYGVQGWDYIVQQHHSMTEVTRHIISAWSSWLLF